MSDTLKKMMEGNAYQIERLRNMVERLKEQNKQLQEENDDLNMRYGSSGSVFSRQHLKSENIKLEEQNKRYKKALITIPFMLMGRTDQILQDEVMKYITDEALED